MKSIAVPDDPRLRGSLNRRSPGGARFADLLIVPKLDPIFNHDAIAN
jgi:hypothetical protein